MPPGEGGVEDLHAEALPGRLHDEITETNRRVELRKLVVGMFMSQEEQFDYVTNNLSSIPGVNRTETVLYLKVLKRTLDRGAMHLKDELMPKYASLIYNGFWFAPEREMLQAAIDKSQAHVTGTVRMKLYKGNASVIGRESPHSLYDQDLVTFEEGSGGYDQRDAAGFIRLNALRLRIAAQRARRITPKRT